MEKTEKLDLPVTLGYQKMRYSDIFLIKKLQKT